MRQRHFLPALCGAAILAVLTSAYAQDAGPGNNPPPPPPAGGPGNGPGPGGGMPGPGGQLPPDEQGMPGRPDRMGMRGPRGMMMGGMHPGGMGQGEVKQIEVTYLGLEAGMVDPALRAQIKLPKDDTGLVAEFVDPDGPAGKARLQRYDILTKLDDQILINPPQLQSLIRMHKEGDEVKLSVIRAGEPKTIDVKLGRKTVPDYEGMFGPGMGMGMGMMGHHPGFPGMGMMGMMGQPFAGGQGPFRARNLSFRDSDMDLTVSEKNGKLYLDAKDTAGKSLFSGPIDTADQRKEVPTAVQKRLDTMAWTNLRHMVHDGAATTGESSGPEAR